MSSSESHIDLGFRDLLFNSGVACMLLFIIFSVRIGKESIDIEDSIRNQNQNFTFSSSYSLIIEEREEKENYKSILAVEIKELKNDQFNLLKQSDHVLWDIDDDIDQFVNYDSLTQSATFYAIIGALKDNELSLKFSDEISLFKKFETTAKIIEGESMIKKGTRLRPTYQRSFDITLPGKELIFRPVEIDPDDPESYLDLFDVR